jgi:hypothetical protein
MAMAVTALAIYDMCKLADRTMSIADVALLLLKPHTVGQEPVAIDVVTRAALMAVTGVSEPHFSHLDGTGKLLMVDVSEKRPSERRASRSHRPSPRPTAPGWRWKRSRPAPWPP